MFIHLGKNSVLRKNDIIGIFELDNVSWSKRSREFLRKCEERGEVVDASEDIPRSFILSNNKGKTRLTLTHVTTRTIIRR